ALELAAARAGVLAVEQIAARLDDGLRLLTGGSRAGPTRQQTLRGSLDWSHALLGEAERVLLRRLAVFAGGFDLAAAEALCGDDGGRPDGRPVGPAGSRPGRGRPPSELEGGRRPDASPMGLDRARPGKGRPPSELEQVGDGTASAAGRPP